MLHARSATPASIVSVAELYAELDPMCRGGLVRAFDAERLVFNRQLRNRRIEPTHGTEDLTSSCICLIGMDRAQATLPDPAFDFRLVLESIFDLSRERAYAGAAGLVLWANAVADGPPLVKALEKAGLPEFRRGEMSLLTTMEVAWLLSGLLHEVRRSGDGMTQSLARLAFSELYGRFNATTRLMKHAAPAAPLTHRLRASIANFADQIYSVQAFAFAGIVLDCSAAISSARSLAERLVELQGPLGQWWWHYDAERGQVAEKFPVYSVHQHAMAPMALMALHSAGGPDHERAIARGMGWLRGNELGVDMIDHEAGTIWRDIERQEGAAAARARQLLELSGRYPPGHSRPALKLNHETRPYEWAWALYAASLYAGSEPRRHIA